MRQVNSLNHIRWECKYHIVFIPKYRRSALFGQIRRDFPEMFRSLAKQKESVIEEGHVLAEHVHMMISIPPKYAVALVIREYILHQEQEDRRIEQLNLM